MLAANKREDASMPNKSGVTLVCGGGGVWGVAWLTGLAMGLLESGIDLRTADDFIGTSAGSVMSSRLALGLDIENLFERQADPAKQPRERAPAIELMAGMGEIVRTHLGDPQERLRAFAKLAREARTISVAERRADIVARLDLGENPAWPDKPLRLTAVDLETLDLVALDAASGASLVDAVSASCAVPGVWPPAEFGGKRYLDGGVWRTADNVQLAQGAEAVLVLSPTGGTPSSPLGGERLAADIARLEGQGAKVVFIAADAASLAAMAPHALDPATREPAAKAGRAQGRAAAAEARKVFG
jgi:NTE family protein